MSSALKWPVGKTEEASHHQLVLVGFLSPQCWAWTRTLWSYFLSHDVLHLYKCFIFIAKCFVIRILQKPFGYDFFSHLLFGLSLGSETVLITKVAHVPSRCPQIPKLCAPRRIGSLAIPQRWGLWGKWWSRPCVCGWATPTLWKKLNVSWLNYILIFLNVLEMGHLRFYFLCYLSHLKSSNTK